MMFPHCTDASSSSPTPILTPGQNVDFEPASEKCWCCLLIKYVSI